MPVNVIERGPSPDGRTVDVEIQVTVDPPGLRQVTLLDRTRRRVSGASDSSATFNVTGCPLQWQVRIDRLLLEFFPLHVEVVQCHPDRPKDLGERETVGPFLHREVVAPTPDCSDPTRARPPSPECVQLNRDAAAARAAVVTACASMRSLVASLNEYRRRYDSYLIAAAVLIAASAAVSLIPGGAFIAFGPAGAAIVLLVFAAAIGLRARAVNDQLTEVRHRLNLAQIRFVVLSSQVRLGCCPWDITANLEAVDCMHMPAWGGLGVGEIGEPGG